MSGNRELYRQTRIALDPVEFMRESYPEIHADDWQKSVLRARSRRILLKCSRQVGKTTTVAAKVAHRALFTPKSLSLIVSPGERQSTEAFGKVVDVMQALPGWKPQFDEDTKTSFRLKNGSRVVSLPGGKPSNLRGYSAASLVVCDEAAFCDNKLLAAMVPMLMVSNGQLICLSTPFGKQGFFYEAWENGGDMWDRHAVLSTDLPRISSGALEEQRKTLGEWQYRQEVLCEFLENAMAYFRDEDIRGALDPDVKPLDWMIA